MKTRHMPSKERLTMTADFCYYISMKKEVKNVERIFVDMDGVVADFLGCSEMMAKPLTSDDAGHTEYDLRKEELTNKRLFGLLPPMVDYADLIGYIKHTGLPWARYSLPQAQSTESWLFMTKTNG